MSSTLTDGPATAGRHADDPRPAGTRSRTLSVRGLQVSVGDDLVAVTDVDLEIARGESVGLVGESGSGKTLTCRAVLGLLPESGQVDAGRIVLGAGPDAVDLTEADRRTWNRVRGARIGAVFQDPASYLNPSLSVGHQLSEQLRVTRGLSRAAAHTRSVELFTEVGLHRPAQVFHQYPHELSGGMLQRILIAIAISCEPDLLIADEATTALDVVIQAEILQLLRRLRSDHDVSLLLVTHDLAVVAETCDRVLVMYGGQIVESGPTAEVLARPQHPYTRALMDVASVGNWERRRLEVIPGQPPSAGEQMPGCRFAPRCQFATQACTSGPVPLLALEGTDARSARCVRLDELPARTASAQHGQTDHHPRDITPGGRP